METITLPHLSSTISIALFRDVQNVSYLRQQLLAGNTDFEYAFLDASVLVSRNQVLAACFRSINDFKNDRLKTRNVHSEIVFSLSPNNNIAESFRRFGLSDATSDVVAIKVGGDADVVAKHLEENVQGSMFTLSDDMLMSLRNEARIRKIYRLEAPKKGEQLSLAGHNEAFVLGSMALRGS